MFSTMHQSALGSLFLLAPTKLHPLWYTPFIFIFFFISAIIAGISMVIVESISHKVFHKQVEGQHVDADKLTLGLGKAGALVMFAYFFLKLQGVIDGHAWGYLAHRLRRLVPRRDRRVRPRPGAALRVRRAQRQGEASSASPA